MLQEIIVPHLVTKYGVEFRFSSVVVEVIWTLQYLGQSS